MGHSLGNNYGKYYGFQSKPVILDAQFTVARADSGGLGVTGVKGQGINKIFMQTSATAAAGNPFVNSTSAGYALIELEYNYTRVYGGPWNARPPVTGSGLAINGSALTAGLPYQIVTVGAGTAGAATIQPVADVAGSLASTWFRLYDSYGNTFIIWFSVSGVGSAPSGVSGTLVQQSITAGDTAATIGAALVVTIGALPSGRSGVFAFTAAGTTTVTVTSTTTANPLAGPPAEGAIATGFTFALTVFTTNLSDWQHVGVPKGVVPAVGVGFIATATGYSTGGGSTGTVKRLTTTGISAMEILGDPNLSLGPIPMGGSPNVGGLVLVQFLAPSFAGTALGNHTHDLNLKNAAVADGATTRVNAGTNLLGANTGSDIVVAGAGANGGIANASAGTPAGTMSLVPTAPAEGTIIYLNLILEAATRVGGNNE